jgi:prepilin-type N-terminal cleavage/methylation domain-containing protein
MFFRNKKSAFTLVELLVVIAIIGLIATLSVIALGNARSKSRDSKRVSDIKQVQTALELFFSDQGRYPTSEEWNSGSLYATGTFGTTTYLEHIPTSPDNADGDCSAGENLYNYYSYNGDTYTLTFCLGKEIGSLNSGLQLATPSTVKDFTHHFSSLFGGGAPRAEWASISSSADGTKLAAVADGCIYTSDASR